MDWSDETSYNGNDARRCPFNPNEMVCDEHICHREDYSCGDGQCVNWKTRMAFHRIRPIDDNCFNKRNLNYMCEVSSYRRAWTLESGLCWPDKDYDDDRYPPWDQRNSANLTDDQLCDYLLRCILSDNVEFDCPCKDRNCTLEMMIVCPGDGLILYPPKGLINPNLFVYYNYAELQRHQRFAFVSLSGSVRCRGYYFTHTEHYRSVIHTSFIYYSDFNHLLCSLTDPNDGYRNVTSRFQYDKHCWSDSVTFNGRSYAVTPAVCAIAGQCLSQYRIGDGPIDCFGEQDETFAFGKDFCTRNVRRHRFRCFNGQHKCLSLYALGTDVTDCSNNYDEMLYGANSPLKQNFRCEKGSASGCNRLKEYIRHSSTNSSNVNSTPCELSSKEHQSLDTFSMVLRQLLELGKSY